MGKSTPDPPPAPDPYATASAQGTSNANTATAQTLLNNANQVTPYGSLTYAQTGSYDITNPDGTKTNVPTMTSTQTLSAPEQRLFNEQNALGNQANNAASLGLQQVNQALKNPVTEASLPALQTSAPSLPNIAYGYDQGGPIQTSVNQQQAATTFAGSDPAYFNAARDQATNAALARLQPSMDQQNSALQSQLANQGVSLGSSAYGAAQQTQNQANNDLRLGAVQTGDAEQQALYGQALNSANYGLQATGQNNAANLAAGSFANSAQGQQNAENQAQAGFYNTAGTQDYQNRLSGSAFSNQAREQSLNDSESINNNIVNQISALMHGGQATAGQYQGYNPGTLDQTPISADVYATAGLQNQQYQAQLQSQAANNTAMGNAFTGLLGGFGKKSDCRLKTNIVPFARARNGLTIYAYHMPAEAHGWHLGFLAHEVALVHPNAVWTGADGFARVDYEMAVA